MNTTASSSTTAIVSQVAKELPTKKKGRPFKKTNLMTVVDEIKPQRDEKGLFLEGNQISVGNEGGRPCLFCREPVRIMQKINLYKEYCEGKVDGKIHIPYLQELCGYDYLDVRKDTLYDWTTNENHAQLHSELKDAIKSLLERQELRLLQATLTSTPTGAIFQLKTNHKYVETEKTLIAGVNNEPMKYEIAIIAKKQREELE